MRFACSVLVARSTAGNQPLRCIALMKSAIAARLLLWPAKRRLPFVSSRLESHT